MSLSTVRNVFCGLFLFSLAVAGGAQAQLLMDQSLVTSVGARGELSAALRENADVNTVIKSLKSRGFTDVNVSPTNPHQFFASTPEGMPVLLTIEPKMGQIISAMPR